MRIAVEISMYAFSTEYEREVLEFVDALHNFPGLTIRVNTLSTQVYGEYDRVMEAVNTSVKRVFSKEFKSSFVMKVLPGDLDPDYRYGG